MLVRETVTQTGADTTTRVAIDTNIQVDGKTAWSLVAMRAFWLNSNVVPAADYYLNAIVSTVNAATTPVSIDEILRVNWTMQNTAGVAVAVVIDQMHSEFVMEERLTVQPSIYVGLQSAATGQANIVDFILQYDLVKISDLQLLRLLQGGA
jgi:hypothetical protein